MYNNKLELVVTDYIKLVVVMFVFQWTIKNQGLDAVMNYGCKSLSSKGRHAKCYSFYN